MSNAEATVRPAKTGYAAEQERLFMAGVRPATTTDRERLMRGTLGLIVLIILVVIALRFFGVI
jgi:hypothetical protein